jgi:hypothetical protein
MSSNQTKVKQSSVLTFLCHPSTVFFSLNVNIPNRQNIKTVILGYLIIINYFSHLKSPLCQEKMCKSQIFKIYCLFIWGKLYILL